MCPRALHWLITAARVDLFLRFFCSLSMCRRDLRPRWEFIWSSLVTNVNDYFGYLIIFCYPWARNWCVCVHFPGFHLKVSACASFFPIPLEILSLLKQFQLNMVHLDTMNSGWWFGWFLHNHLKWLDQAAQVDYSFKKYICLINTSPGTLQVSVMVVTVQSLGTCGLMITAGLDFRPHSRAGLYYWAKKNVDRLHR